MRDAFFTKHVLVPGGSITKINILPDDRIVCGSSDGCVLLFEDLEIGCHPHRVVLKPHSECVKGLWPVGEQIIICDKSGSISSWVCCGEDWTQKSALKLDHIQLNVCAMSTTSLMLCAGFEDGTVKTVSHDLQELWDIREVGPIIATAWSTDGYLLLVGCRTDTPSLSVFDHDGHRLRKVIMDETTHLLGPLVACSWNQRGVVVAFSKGIAHFMRGLGDEYPIYIDCQCDISLVQWCHSGELFAFVSKRMILLFDASGQHVKSVSVANSADGEINDIVWSNNDRVLYVSVGSSICVLSLMGITKYCLNNSGVCFMYQKDSIRFIPFDDCYPVFNATYANLVDISCDCEKDWILTVIRVGDSFDVILVKPSAPILKRKRIIDSLAYVDSALYGEIIATASPVHVQIWNTVTDTLFFFRGNDPSRGFSGLLTDTSSHPPEDSFVGVTLGKGGKMAIARESGAIHIYEITTGSYQLVKTLGVETRPERIRFNCDSSQLSVIDFNNKLLTINVETGQVSHMKRDECWDLVWSTDSPTTFACMDKNRVYVIRDGKPEEPLSLGDERLVGLKDLDIITVSRAESIKYVPSKTLRDCKEVLDTVTNIEDAFQYVERRPHPRLWRMIAENALLRVPARFDIYEKCISNADPTEAEIILNALSRFPDPVERQSEGLLWLGKLKEAEQLLETCGRLDLLIKLKRKMGDYEWLATRTECEWSTVTTAEEIGDFYFVGHRFSKALEWYRLNPPCFTKNRLDCLLIMNRYEEIVEISRAIPIHHPLTMEVARILKMSCMCDEAVELYVRAKKPSDALVASKLFGRQDLVHRIEKYFGMQSDPADIQGFLKDGMYSEVLASMRRGGDKGILPQVFRETMLEQRSNCGLIMKKKAAVLMALEGCSDWSQAEGFHFMLVAGNQLAQGNYDNAFMAALRMSMIDFGFTTADRRRLFKLQAALALLCSQRESCSRAFVHLEVDGGLSPNEGMACKMLAMKVFRSPWDKSDEKKCCPRCKAATLSRFTIACSLCGEIFKYEIYTGYPIIDEHRVPNMCSICTHVSYGSRATQNYCPLCHQALK